MPSLNLARSAFLAAALTGTLTPAWSQAQPPAGRLLASNCFQCHGTNGKGQGFERLAGMKSREIVEELMEMRSGKEGKGIMAKHSLGYTDGQLQALAGYLSTQR